VGLEPLEWVPKDYQVGKLLANVLLSREYSVLNCVKIPLFLYTSDGKRYRGKENAKFATAAFAHLLSYLTLESTS
jgi:hypothetical protein